MIMFCSRQAFSLFFALLPLELVVTMTSSELLFLFVTTDSRGKVILIWILTMFEHLLLKLSLPHEKL